MPADKLERQAIDKQFAAMADDSEYLALNEAIAEECAESEWEGLQLGEADGRNNTQTQSGIAGHS
jgi:hypothetical protein